MRLLLLRRRCDGEDQDAQPLARCGYRDYAVVTKTFEALRPTDGGAFSPGQPDR